MATQVWKCDYCYTFFSIENEALKHEKQCSFNVRNKKCTTCKYYEETGDGYTGSDTRCMKKESEFYNKMQGFKEKYETCKFWESDDK